MLIKNKLDVIFKLKSKSNLLTIIAIFIIMIAFPVFIFGYLSSYYIIKNSNTIDHEYAQKTLEYTMNDIDNYLMKIEDVMFYTYLEIKNELNNNLLSKSEYQKMTIINILSNFKQTNPNIESILYTDNSQYVFSSESGYSDYISHPLKDSLLLNESIAANRQSWYKIDIPVYNPEKNTSTIVDTISHQIKFSTNKNKLIVSMNVKSINSILSSLAASNSLQILLDSNNNVITYTGGNSLIKDDLESWLLTLPQYNTGLTGLDEKINLAGMDYKLTTIKSDSTGWKFINLTPFDILYRNANYIKHLTVQSSLICILIGLLMLLFTYLRLYKPLVILKNKVSSLLNYGYHKGSSEFGVIGNAITTLLVNNNIIKNRLELNYTILKENFLKSYLEGNGLPNIENDVNAYKEYLNLNPNIGSFVVCLIRYNCPKNNSEYYTYQKNITAILKREVEANYPLFELVWTINGLAVILQRSGNTLSSISHEEFHTLLLKMTKSINTSINCSCTIGVGNFVDSFSELSVSYRNSILALQFSIVEGKEKIYFSDDLKPYDDINNNNGFSAYSDFDNRNLNACINKLLNSKCENNIINIFQESISPYCDKQSFSFLHIMSTYNNFIKTLLKYIVDNNISANFKIALDDLLNVNDISEMLTNLHSLTDIIAKYNSEDRNLDIISSIIQYIDNNYSEDITLEGMAEKVFISPNYLSKLFKQYYGTNFNRYIISKRLDTAEKYLVTTNMQIQQIALKVGYNNLNSFTKMFKLYKGVSPYEYRKKIVNKNMSDTLDISSSDATITSS